MSEAEVAANFAAVLEKLKTGVEVVVDQDNRPVAIIRSPQARGRSISECIALAKAHEGETGQAPVLDPDFAADVEAIICQRERRSRSVCR